MAIRADGSLDVGVTDDISIDLGLAMHTLGIGGKNTLVALLTWQAFNRVEIRHGFDRMSTMAIRTHGCFCTSLRYHRCMDTALVLGKFLVMAIAATLIYLKGIIPLSADRDICLTGRVSSVTNGLVATDTSDFAMR